MNERRMIKFFRPSEPSAAPGPADDLEAIADAIRQETDDSNSAQARVRELEGERREALLAGDDARLDALDAMVTREERTVERAALRLPELRRRHEVERRKLKDQAWEEHKQRYAALVDEFLGPAQAALETAHAIVKHFETAGRYGNEHRAVAETPSPPFLNGGTFILSRDLLDRFALARQGMLGGETHSGQPSVPNSAKTGVYEELTGNTIGNAAPRQHPTKMLDSRGAQPPPARRREPKVPSRATEAGEVELIILRDGVEIGSDKFIAGDRIIAGPDLADRLLRGGAADSYLPPTIQK
jgi:hypothetical protein